LNKKRAFELGPEVTFTDDPSALVSGDVDIVVELMGGLDTAKALMLDAFAAGKHVVTANKALLAEHGAELFELAAQKGVGLYYEASVCGGIPIVQALKESLASNRIENLTGILNGTANYILSEMTTSEVDFDTALRQAQEQGFAEADPTLDIEGMDTAHKLVILIRLAFGLDYPLEKLQVQGISRVEPQDIQFAREFGYRIKLLAQVRDVDGKIEAGVYPTLVKYTYLLARVGGAYNAVRLEGNAVGPVFFHGLGAGGLPTGSAVMADVMALARDSAAPNNTGFLDKRLPPADIMDPDNGRCKHYVRLTVKDRPGVLAIIGKILGDRDISLAQVVQKGNPVNGIVPVVFITHEALVSNLLKAIREIDAQPFLAAPTVHYRILA